METWNLRLLMWDKKKPNVYFLNTDISFFIFKIFKNKMNCIMQNKLSRTTDYVSVLCKNNLVNNCALSLKFSNTMTYREKNEGLVEML